jgi:polysaccharide biosynthesis/export protein
MGERVNLRGVKSWSGRKCLMCGLGVAVLLTASSGMNGQDVSIVQTPQQANERIRTLTMGSHAIPHDYVIGSGDLVGITVFDVPELTRDVRVSQRGNISIPLVPVRLSIAGLTESQAEQKIAEVLEINGLVTHPEVSVMVKEHKSKPITIVGAVARPMVYEADRTVTLLEAIAEAGGIANDAGDTVIIARAPPITEVPNPAPIPDPNAPGSGVVPAAGTEEMTVPKGVPPPVQTDKQVFPLVTEAEAPQTPPVPQDKFISVSDANGSRGANTYTINLNELLETGDTRNNIILEAGDVVTVPHAGIVYVMGAVNRPGGFVMSNDRTALTTMKVLSLAGGLTRIAKLDHAFIIRMDDRGRQINTEVDLKKILRREAEDVTMRPSDILYIPDDHVKEALYRAGEIAIAVGTGVALYRVAYR